jgi:gas vesicle protein
MGAIKRLAKFTGGGVVGAAIGSVTATLLAPESGNELQRKLRERIQQAKLAGLTAKAETEEALIQRFRGRVNDPNALEDKRVQSHAEVAEAVRAVGLGLNAPGAIAAQRPIAADPAGHRRAYVVQRTVPQPRIRRSRDVAPRSSGHHDGGRGSAVSCLWSHRHAV